MARKTETFAVLTPGMVKAVAAICGGNQTDAMSPRRANPPNDATYAGRLGAAVKARRQKIGMSVAEFADAVGVSEATIYDWEKGRRTLDINYMPAIAVVLKTTILKLFPAE